MKHSAWKAYESAADTLWERFREACAAANRSWLDPTHSYPRAMQRWLRQMEAYDRSAATHYRRSL